MTKVVDAEQKLKSVEQPDKAVDMRSARGVFLTDKQTKGGGASTIAKSRSSEWDALSGAEKEKWHKEAVSHAQERKEKRDVEKDRAEERIQALGEGIAGEVQEIKKLDDAVKEFVRQQYVNASAPYFKYDRDHFDKAANKWNSITTAKNHEAAQDEIVVKRWKPPRVVTLCCRFWGAMNAIARGEKNQVIMKKFLSVTSQKQNITIADSAQFAGKDALILILGPSAITPGTMRRVILVCRCVKNPQVVLGVFLSYGEDWEPKPKQTMRCPDKLSTFDSSRLPALALGQRDFKFWLAKWRWGRKDAESGLRTLILRMEEEVKIQPQFASVEKTASKMESYCKLEKVDPIKGDIKIKREYKSVGDSVGVWAGKLAMAAQRDEMEISLAEQEMEDAAQDTSSSSSAMSSSDAQSSSSASSAYVSFADRLLSFADPDAKAARRRQREWAAGASLTAYRYQVGAYENQDKSTGEKRIASPLTSWAAAVRAHAHPACEKDPQGGIFRSQIRKSTGGKSFRCGDGDESIAAGRAYVDVYCRSVEFAVRRLPSFIQEVGGGEKEGATCSPKENCPHLQQEYADFVAGQATKRAAAAADPRAAAATEAILTSLRVSLPLLCSVGLEECRDEDASAVATDAELD